MHDEHLTSQIVIFTNINGDVTIQARLEKENIWLSLKQLAELFERDKSVISRHLKKIFTEGELVENAVVANYATTVADGKIYEVTYYNILLIIILI